MKRVSKANIQAGGLIIARFILYGFAKGSEFIESIKTIINLPKIEFAGFIAFAIVEIIMALGARIGIWFGVKGGSVLYTIMLFIVGFILF